MNSDEQPWQKLLPYAAGIAVVCGILARFTGLGSAPFAVDEYYLSQSIASVVRHGVPSFDCGGYYMRGLILQYLSAALQWGGLSAELAPRLVCAIASLVALPAAYLLGKRIHSPLVGFLTVILLCLSVWEIEMARFGRMYAPFQTVFLWYIVYFLRYTVDREAKALWPMIALSIAGPFVWEGGIFLLLANLLPVFLLQPDGRLPRGQWRYLAAGTLLLTLCFAFLKFDFRGMTAESMPPQYDPAITSALTDPLSGLRAPLLLLPGHPLWLTVAAIPFAASLMAIGWIWTLRSRPLLAVGLLAALGCAGVHQFLAAGAILLLLLMVRYIDRDELFGLSARWFQLALGLLVAFWVVFGAASVDWGDPHIGGPARGAAMLAYQFLRFPDFIGVVARPWIWAAPHLGAVLLVLCGIAVVRMAGSAAPMGNERALLVVFLALLLAASASHPPRQETRYVFNLYPIALIIALTTLAWLTDLVFRSPAAAAISTAAVALCGFALTEDFSPHHMLQINTREETFRLRMTPGMQSHLVIRDDYRSLAHWLQTNVPANVMVINGVHGLDHYYPGFRFFFVDASSPNFPDWSCRHGTVERWGNYPLLHSVPALANAIGTNGRAYLVAFGYEREDLLRSLAALSPTIAASEGAIIIIELRG